MDYHGPLPRILLPQERACVLTANELITSRQVSIKLQTSSLQPLSGWHSVVKSKLKKKKIIQLQWLQQIPMTGARPPEHIHLGWHCWNINVRWDGRLQA